MFVILWHFEVKPSNQGRFEKAYGPDGDWVQLFRRDPCFRGTQLLRDPSHEDCYFTVDFWNSETAYRTFLTVHRRDYDALDSSFQGVTVNERHVLSFEIDSTVNSRK